MELEIKYLLQNMLEDFFDKIKKKAITLEEIFQDRDQEMIADIRKMMDTKKITVLIADPRSEADLPCIAIIRNNENEAQNYFGDVAENDDEAETDFTVTEIKAMQFSNDYSLEIWTTNPDVREIIYRMAKYALFIYRDQLTLAGLNNQKISGQDKQGPMSPYFPTFVYIASLNLGATNELQTKRIVDKIPANVRVTINGGN